MLGFGNWDWRNRRNGFVLRAVALALGAVAISRAIEPKNDLTISVLVLGLGGVSAFSARELRNCLAHNEIRNREYRFWSSVFSSCATWSVMLAFLLGIFYINGFTIIAKTFSSLIPNETLLAIASCPRCNRHL